MADLSSQLGPQLLAPPCVRERMLVLSGGLSLVLICPKSSPIAAHILRVIAPRQGCPPISRHAPPGPSLQWWLPWFQHHSANRLRSPAHLGAPLLDSAPTLLLWGTWHIPTLPTPVLLNTSTSVPVRELSLLLCHLLLTLSQILVAGNPSGGS